MKLHAILLVIFSSFLSSILAQESPTIGIANTDSILSSLPEYEETTKMMKNYTQQWTKQVEIKTEELEKKKENFVKNREEYIIEVLEEKAKEIQRLQQSLEELQKKAQANVQKKQAKLIEPLVMKIKKAIREVAQKKGYTFILAHNTQANYPLLYASSTDDITQIVIERLSK